MRKLALITLLAAFVFSCNKNLPPSIESMTAEPNSVYPGDTVMLTFQANPGNDNDFWVHFEWSAHEGILINPSDPSGTTYLWVAPRIPGSHYLILTINDEEFTVKDSILVTVMDTLGAFIDDRDGHEYQWVKIGTQIWMAENLAYLPKVSPPEEGVHDDPYYYVYDYYGNDVNEAKLTENYSAYGVLYNWVAAMNNEGNSSQTPSGVQGICPKGWHLPSLNEFYLLFGACDDYRTDLTSETGWSWLRNGENKKGFNAFPGGYLVKLGENHRFIAQNDLALFWTTTYYEHAGTYIPKNAICVIRLIPVLITGGHEPWSLKDEGLSIRCVKDD
jgi:uncharacterized protein (TIGR02145 family)